MSRRILVPILFLVLVSTGCFSGIEGMCGRNHTDSFAPSERGTLHLAVGEVTTEHEAVSAWLTTGTALELPCISYFPGEEGSAGGEMRFSTVPRGSRDENPQRVADVTLTIEFNPDESGNYRVWQDGFNDRQPGSASPRLQLRHGVDFQGNPASHTLRSATSLDEEAGGLRLTPPSSAAFTRLEFRDDAGSFALLQYGTTD